MDSAFKLLEIKKQPAPEGQSTEDKGESIGTAEKKPSYAGKGFVAYYIYVPVAIVLMFAFLLLVHLVGFIAGTFIFIPLAARILGYKHIKKLLISSVGITCFMYLIFIVIMKSTLPPGLIVELFLR
jgi:hypothetical protein